MPFSKYVDSYYHNIYTTRLLLVLLLLLSSISSPQVRYIRQRVLSSSGPLLLLGDFNHMPDELPILEILAIPGIKATNVVERTYEDGTLIDYIFYRDLNFVYGAVVESGDTSDHFPVVAHFTTQ